MKIPSAAQYDELVKLIADTAYLISQLTWEMFQEAKKDNPHLHNTQPLSKKQQAQLPKFVPSEITLEMTEQIMGLQDLLDLLLEQFKEVLRIVSRNELEWARLYHERLRPGSVHDPMTRDIVKKLDAIYKAVKEEKGYDKPILN